MKDVLSRSLLFATLCIFAGGAVWGAGGILKVTSFPTGAEVWVNGVNTGKLTPMSTNLPEGDHTVTVQLPGTGWRPDTRTVTIVAGNNDLSVTLLPSLDGAARLNVSNVYHGAGVMIPQVLGPIGPPLLASNPLDFQTPTRGGTSVFRLQARDPSAGTGLSTSQYISELALLHSSSGADPVATGFAFNPDGTLTFARNQTFPGTASLSQLGTERSAWQAGDVATLSAAKSYADQQISVAPLARLSGGNAFSGVQTLDGSLSFFTPGTAAPFTIRPDWNENTWRFETPPTAQRHAADILIQTGASTAADGVGGRLIFRTGSGAVAGGDILLQPAKSAAINFAGFVALSPIDPSAETSDSHYIFQSIKSAGQGGGRGIYQQAINRGTEIAVRWSVSGTNETILTMDRTSLIVPKQLCFGFGDCRSSWPNVASLEAAISNGDVTTRNAATAYTDEALAIERDARSRADGERARLTGGNSFTGDQGIAGSVSLSGTGSGIRFADGTIQTTAATGTDTGFADMIVVNAVGTLAENGQALLSALARANARAPRHVIVKLGPGVYNVGTGALTLSNVSLVGSGRERTGIGIDRADNQQLPALTLVRSSIKELTMTTFTLPSFPAVIVEGGGSFLDDVDFSISEWPSGNALVVNGSVITIRRSRIVFSSSSGAALVVDGSSVHLDDSVISVPPGVPSIVMGPNSTVNAWQSRIHGNVMATGPAHFTTVAGELAGAVLAEGSVISCRASWDGEGRPLTRDCLPTGP